MKDQIEEIRRHVHALRAVAWGYVGAETPSETIEHYDAILRSLKQIEQQTAMPVSAAPSAETQTKAA
ncbi:hypothetical protein Pan216_28110 [Planctomycetes bacterium Pan216]|uniref:Uncharacterized protein n=1 Tax=Kolteria novifilia TaxID=2527975 RepID=A0A518B4T3_9BACT|nr:hypothetical protein Pan216_28110 [Planctomycetes bacterium Pan216]